MLQSLSIRNVVLIEKLDLTFEKGLTVLTGETGAGKSILLDALSLALGERSNSALIRPGAEQAIVIAEFFIENHHPLFQLLNNQGIEISEDSLLLRRVVSKDGRSKAFLNDQPISGGLLATLGENLIEIHGQFDQLLIPETHLSFLDTYASLDKEVEALGGLFEDYKSKEKALKAAEELQQTQLQNKDFIKFSLEELEQLNPESGEEERLLAERDYVINRAKIMDAIHHVHEVFSGDNSIGVGVASAQKAIERVQSLAPNKLNELAEAVHRLDAEFHEVEAALAKILDEDDQSRAQLENIEDRLHTLRSVARKHAKTVEELPELYADLKEKMMLIDGGAEGLEHYRLALQTAKATYLQNAQKISIQRQAAIEDLEKKVTEELPPLKMDKAHFKVVVEELAEDRWNAKGLNRIEFLIQTNPGMPFGSLSKIASGGERGRFMLALKVVLARQGYVPTLIFDEIDSGVGGAVAAAVGERLRRLSQNLQVLAITHSPQVAACAHHHLTVQKQSTAAEVFTEVITLDRPQRHEEIARMLAGETITEEARAAASRLLAVGE